MAVQVGVVMAPDGDLTSFLLSCIAEIQIGIDQAFMSLALKKHVSISSSSAPFPEIYQQSSKESKQVDATGGMCVLWTEQS